MTEPVTTEVDERLLAISKKLIEAAREAFRERAEREPDTDMSVMDPLIRLRAAHPVQIREVLTKHFLGRGVLTTEETDTLAREGLTDPKRLRWILLLAAS